MKILWTLLLGLVTSLSAFAELEEGDYVVVLNQNDSPRQVARDHGVGPKRQYTNAIHGFSGHLNKGQANRLARDSRVQIIEPDLVCHTLAQTIPTGVRRIGSLSNALWQASSVTPINVNVAIIDSGIELTNPELNVYAQATFVAGTATANDDNGHGTHVAGICGARNNTSGVVGVAPGCKLWAVKVLNSQGLGNDSDIIAGIDYVTLHSDQIQVANMSLGGPGYSSAMRAAIQGAVAKGVVFVVAAGNSQANLYGADGILGTDDDAYPGCFPECMTVSALADSDGIPGGIGAITVAGKDDTLASFSNFAADQPTTPYVSSPGGAIDIAAPGVSIYSTVPTGTCKECDPSGFKHLSGTSMASPHVAGAVALYIAQFGRATTAAGVYSIRQAIINSAEPQTSWGINPTNPNPIDHYPEGALNVAHFGTAIGYTSIILSFPGNNQSVDATTTQAIPFAGSAVDPLDGDISAQLRWVSSISGSIGTGRSFSTTLAAGNHTITVSCTNSSGLVSRAYCFANVRAVTLTPPTVTIQGPTNGVSFAATDNVPFYGTASDAIDGLITRNLTWTSSLDGFLGNGTSFWRHLSAGVHVITASVVNSAGITGSAKVTVTATGTAPPPPPTNYPPVVSITQPANGSSFPQGTNVTIVASASDVEDGDLTASISISDNVAGLLGTGGVISTNGFTVGSHTITASVQDSAGAVASASVGITILATPATNAAPVVTITSPANGTSFVAGTSVSFAGTAIDPEDGALTVIWNDSAQGAFGTGNSLSYILTVPGTHVITASATDSGGKTGSASVSVTVTAPPPTNALPVISITSPANGAVLPYNTSLTCTGTATDAEDGNLTSVMFWNDSLVGFLGNGGSVTFTPQPGTHTISARATDSAGGTGVASRTITVSAPVANLVVALTASPPNVVNKQKILITATTTTNSVACSGVTCAFSIKGASGKVQNKSVVSNTSGVASFYLQINRTQLGVGTATVTVNATKSGANPGYATTTFNVLK